MKRTDALVVPAAPPSETLQPELPEYHPGDWFWYTPAAETDPDDDLKPEEPEEPTLVCVLHVGSNYVAVEDAREHSFRIHARDVDQKLRPAPDAETVIRSSIAAGEGRMRLAVKKIRELTMRLGISPTLAMTDGTSSTALTTLSHSPDPDAYKTELLEAKKTTLPALFSEVESAASETAAWARFRHAPLAAEAKRLRKALTHVDDQVLNIELYAGLKESLVQIHGGEPAGMTAKLHLLQRRLYMDEECLAHYEAGGMTFEAMEEFDEWLCRPEHLSRLLPFERSLVSFRVRRSHRPFPEYGSFVQFWQLIHEAEADQLTFLYIRNGEQVFRLRTAAEFGEHLFPDLTERPGSRAVRWSHHDREFITEDDYQERLREYEGKREKDRRSRAVWDAYQERKEAAEARGEELSEEEPDYPSHFWPRPPDHELFSPESVYYDDMRAEIARDFREHNRIALIVQGLLDRSLALHPHPPWSIHTDEGFSRAIELVYDESRALVAGAAPDFLAYQARLNASIKPGTLTVGQESVWDARAREEERSSRRSRHGNPGPSRVHAVEHRSKSDVLRYSWHRKGQSEGRYDKDIRATMECGIARVLNVDAYKPGDFKAFFADPRTRQDYLEWAPLLLAAEDYYASRGGENRDVGASVPKAARGPETGASRRARIRRQERKQFHVQDVELTAPITTRGGAEYRVGMLFRARYTGDGYFTFHELGADRVPIAKDGGTFRAKSPAQFARVVPGRKPEPDDEWNDDE